MSQFLTMGKKKKKKKQTIGAAVVGGRKDRCHLRKARRKKNSSESKKREINGSRLRTWVIELFFFLCACVCVTKREEPWGRQTLRPSCGRTASRRRCAPPGARGPARPAGCPAESQTAAWAQTLRARWKKKIKWIVDW